MSHLKVTDFGYTDGVIPFCIKRELPWLYTVLNTKHSVSIVVLFFPSSIAGCPIQTQAIYSTHRVLPTCYSILGTIVHVQTEHSDCEQTAGEAGLYSSIHLYKL